MCDGEPVDDFGREQGRPGTYGVGGEDAGKEGQDVGACDLEKSVGVLHAVHAYVVGGREHEAGEWFGGLGGIGGCDGAHPVRVVGRDGNVTLVAAGKTCYPGAGIIESVCDDNVGYDGRREFDGVHRTISQCSGPGVDIDPLRCQLGAILNDPE